MNEIYTRPLLNDQELSQIWEIMSQAEWSRSSTVGNVYLKPSQKNTEMVNGHHSPIGPIVMAALDRDAGFRDMVFPGQSTGVIVSRTDVDQGFKVHHDVPSNGDFSTSVFLSDPDTYEGGELTMWLGGKEQKFALPAGHAITYPTGIPHCVSEVTKGVRYAVVFWTTSIVRDHRYRDILAELRKIRSLLPKSYGYDVEAAVNDPAFLIQDVENKIIRYFLQ